MIKQFLLYACLLLVTVALIRPEAAVARELTFSGSAVHCDGESNSLIVRSGKREMAFFVVGKVVRAGTKIGIGDLGTGCPLVVTYQKNKNRLVATRVEAQPCEGRGIKQ